MEIDIKFDDIRPYNASEIPLAMKRIAKSEFFLLLSNFVFPQQPVEQIRQMVSNITTTDEFQKKVMYFANKQIIERSMDSFTFSGVDYLKPNKPYLFVSNHRDIMLDASLLQNVLVDNGLSSSQITFGANLMKGETIIDVGKSNKMFRVERGGNMKEFYKYSMHLSEYIRHVICQVGESVWIAQRNGRTKNGLDRTDQGIIKMFCMSDSTDKIEALNSLNIVPIAISYQWEPCDILKALELYESQFTTYTKKPGEDLNSIITGIVQKKGKVHLEICKPIEKEELLQYQSLTSNEYNKAVANLIDSRINNAYKLYSNNYIAYDMRYATSKYIGEYTPEQKNDFIKHIKAIESYPTCNYEQLLDIFLSIYSNPILSKEQQLKD